MKNRTINKELAPGKRQGLACVVPCACLPRQP